MQHSNVTPLKVDRPSMWFACARAADFGGMEIPSITRPSETVNKTGHKRK